MSYLYSNYRSPVIYNCNYCSLRFTTKASLKRHKRTDHKDQYVAEFREVTEHIRAAERLRTQALEQRERMEMDVQDVDFGE